MRIARNDKNGFKLGELTMSEKEKASASTLAERNIEQEKSYHKGDYRSSPNLKEILGVLLLLLAAGHSEPDGWRLFEVLLGQYCEIKQTMGASL